MVVSLNGEFEANYSTGMKTAAKQGTGELGGRFILGVT
jgi:hypothetical protein